MFERADRRTTRWTSLALLVLGLAGCGGSGSTMYSSGSMKSCLEQHGASTDSTGWDYISNGDKESYSADVDGTTVVIGFFRSENNAKRAIAAYKLLGAAASAPLSDILFRYGNVTLAWDGTPTDAQRKIIDSCLASAKA